MKTHKIAIFLIALVAMVTGCKAAFNSQNDMSWIFETPADPIQVGVELDSAKTVEAVIPVEGGTLSVTGADGTLYTLEIPSDALLSETTIGMTPVSSISNMPFGNERTYAVQLSPEGLFFQNFATLTISPAEEIPLAEQITFGYQGDGKDLILAAPVVDSSEIKIQVLHFSGNGVTQGLLADIEPVRQQLGGDAERRLQNAVSAELIRIRQEGGEWVGAAVRAAFEDVFQQYEEQVVKPRVAAAGESCANGKLAIQTVYQLERLRQLAGQSTGGDPLAKYPGLMDKASQVCVIEEFELCVEDHVIHRMLPVWTDLVRQYALLGINDNAVLREARELTVKCLTFKLKFESTGTLKDVGGGGYESTVKSEITLRFNPDDFKISGEAPLVNEEFEFTMPDPCVVTSVPGGGTFEVFRLKILTARPDFTSGGPTDITGWEVGFLLSYMPGNTSESASYVCEFAGGGRTQQSLPAFPAWTSAFLATHSAELDSSSFVSDIGGFIAIDWEVFGDEYFAKKEWIKETAEMVEVGTFKLYHTPGQ